MDKNPASFDALYSEPHVNGPLMQWDDLLVFVRGCPQIAAVDAALLARHRPGATVADFGDPSAPAKKPGARASSCAPTWDGLDTVIAELRRQHLLPATLPRTRSPTVMLMRLLEELALVFGGHRGAHPDHGILASEPEIEELQVRFETECITWLIAGRLGLRAAAAGSLKGYLKDGELMPPLSRDRVLRTVDAVEGLFGGAPTFGETIRHEAPSLFALDEQLTV